MLMSTIRFIGIVSFLFLAVNFLYIRKVTEDIKSGNSQPKILVEFPIHKTSQQKYLATKKKIEYFSITALENQASTLTLNADDINNIYTKGINLNKFTPGKFFYYQIQDNLIVETRMEWPSLVFMSVVSTETRTFSFSVNNEVVLETSKFIKTNIGEINDDKYNITAPLIYSKIISYIFGGIKSPSDAPGFSQDAAESQRTVKLIGKIKSIEIKDDSLIIKT